MAAEKPPAGLPGAFSAPFPMKPVNFRGVTCVLYDAFSNKMNGELWSESFLIETMNPMIAKNCKFLLHTR